MSLLKLLSFKVSLLIIKNDKPAVIERSNSMILNDKKLAEYVHSVDESPGIYGEIADYWQTTDKDEFDNKNEDTEFTDYDYATVTILQICFYY